MAAPEVEFGRAVISPGLVAERRVSATVIELDQLPPERLGVALDLIRQPASLRGAEDRGKCLGHAFTCPVLMSLWTIQIRYASASSAFVSLRSTGSSVQVPFLSQPLSRQVSLKRPERRLMPPPQRRGLSVRQSL